MLKPNTVILAVVLSLPFGLAIHHEVTKQSPKLAQAEPERVHGSMGDIDFGNLDIEVEPSAAALALADEYPEPPAPPEPPVDNTSIGETALRAVFGAEPATLGSELSAVRFAVKAEELRQLVPTLPAWNERSDEPGRFDVHPEFRAAGETLLSDLVVETYRSGEEVAAHLRATWGAPTIAADGSLPDIWISRDQHMRAALSMAAGEGDATTVVFSPVQTLQELLTSANSFAFETGPALAGATLKQLKASYPRVLLNDYYQDSAELDIPGIASDPGASPFVRVKMRIQSGMVASMGFKIGCGTGCDQVVQAFRDRFGAEGAGQPATRADDGEDQVYRFGSAPEVTVTIYAHETRVAVVAVTP